VRYSNKSAFFRTASIGSLLVAARDQRCICGRVTSCSSRPIHSNTPLAGDNPPYERARLFRSMLGLAHGPHRDVCNLGRGREHQGMDNDGGHVFWLQ
jgi:hypothetical protein